MSSPIRAVSFGLVAIGLLLTAYAFAFDTEVTTQTGLVGGMLVAGGSNYNVGLMQQQMMLLQTGLACALAGVVLLACTILGAKAARSVTDMSHVDKPETISSNAVSALSETSGAVPQHQSRKTSRRRNRSKRK